MRVDQLELLVERHRVGDLARPLEHDVDRIERSRQGQATEEAARALEQRGDGGRERARRDDVELVHVERACRVGGHHAVTSRPPRG